MKRYTSFVLILAMLLCMASCDRVGSDIESRRRAKETEESEVTTSSVSEASEPTEASVEETTEATTTAEETSATTTEATTTAEETTVETTAETTAQATEETTDAIDAKDTKSETSSEYIDFDIVGVEESIIEQTDEGIPYGASYDYQSIVINDSDYPELKKVLDDISSADLKELDINLKENYDFAKDDIANNPTSYFIYYSSEQMEVRRADKKVFSVIDHQTSYSGGAHGYYGNLCYNYDPVTGKLLTLDDIVKDKSRFKEKVVEKLAELPENRGVYPDYTDIIDSYNDDDFILNITYEGVEVFFNPYEVGPYAAGMISVIIPYESNEDIFNQDLWEGLPSDHIRIFDLNFDDNNLEYYTITNEDVEYTVSAPIMDYAYTNLMIKANDQVFEFNNFYAFSYTPYLVRSGSDTFIYVFTTQDSDYAVIEIYKAEGDKVTYVGHFDAGYRTFIDPSEFVLSLRTDVLGTSSIYGEYTIGKDGMPVLLSDTFLYTNPRSLTLKEALTGVVIEDGEEVEEEYTAKAGSKVTQYSTDNESYVDLVAEDGTIFRCTYKVGWPMRINDKDIYAYFDDEDLKFAS